MKKKIQIPPKIAVLLSVNSVMNRSVHVLLLSFCCSQCAACLTLGQIVQRCFSLTPPGCFEICILTRQVQILLQPSN